MQQNITEDLEAMIDQHGLLHILTGLDLVCSEKAEHIRVNWQDKKLARQWDRHANAIYTASRKISD